MKKAIILLTALLIISDSLEAQKKADVLYLKNGSIVTGKLLGKKDNSYKIKTADGFLFTFGPDEVEKFILGEKSEPEEVKIINPNGWGFGIESGLMLGSSEYNFPILFSRNPGVTYTFRNSHTLAMLTGVEIFDQFTLPLLFEYKFNILKKDVSPFVYARGGGLVGLGGENSSDEYKGGWTFGLGTGFRWPIKGYESFIKFGYRYAYTVHTGTSYNWVDYSNNYKCSYHVNFNRMEMRWGFKF